jgi:hypothetical protein
MYVDWYRQKKKCPDQILFNDPTFMAIQSGRTASLYWKLMMQSRKMGLEESKNPQLGTQMTCYVGGGGGGVAG